MTGSPALEADCAIPGGTAVVRWAALGDSFTAGTYPGEETWAKLVGQRLAGRRRVSLVNFARAGATAKEMAAEQLPPAIAGRPDLLTLVCGGNDVIGRIRPSLDEIHHDLDACWRTLRPALPETRFVTCTYPAIAPGAVRSRTRQRVERGLTELNEIVRGLAQRHGVRCVELANHPGESSSENYAADGIHPSATGHRAAAEVLGAAIDEALDETKPEAEA